MDRGVKQRKGGPGRDGPVNALTSNDTFEDHNTGATKSDGQGSPMAVNQDGGKWLGGLVHHNYLPTFLADNEFLLNSHRPQLNSFMACFKSMFSLHTETWNIWTHVGGSVLFIGLSVHYLQRAVSLEQTVTFLIFFLGAIICMGCSGIYHTVLCHSEHINRIFSRIDYCGVIILIMASWAPWLHYGFYCSIASKITYAILVSLTGILCIFCVLHDKFAGKEFRVVRAGLFVALGLTGVAPAMHYALVYSLTELIYEFGYLIMMAVIYIMGAGIYAARLPERLLPGKFDIWFQSHQIMHVCVVVAAVLCYHGASTLADHRMNNYFDCTGAISGSEKITRLDL